MMTIGGITGAGSGVQGGAGMNPQADSVTRDLQSQIAQKQKELRELSSDGNMTAEDKMKKKQEIQQEIANLNQQLRQHQLEQRREQQAAAQSSPADGAGNAAGAKSGGAKTSKSGNTKPGGSANADGKAKGLSQAGMRSLISADSSMKQAQVQGNVATRMEDWGGVLEAEIKLDAGGNTQAKEAELAQTRQKAMDAEQSQMNTLANANQELREAAKAEQGSGAMGSGTEYGSGAKGKDIETGNRDKAVEKTGNRPEPADGYQAKAGEAAEDAPDDTKGGTAAQETARNNVYVHVDVRL